MKNESAEKLFELLGEIDDDIIADALMAENKKMLKKSASKGKNSIFHSLLFRISAIVLSLVLSVTALVVEETKPTVNSFVSGQISSNSSNPSNISSFAVAASSEISSLDEEQASSDTAASSKVSSQNASSDESSTILQSSSESSSATQPESSKTQNSSSKKEESTSSENTQSESTVAFISSIDKLNFYAGKAVIEQFKIELLSGKTKTSASPISVKPSNPVIFNLSDNRDWGNINEDTVYRVKSATYFTLELKEKNGFLAKKLGGTGVIEVVITENNINDMITFKRGEKFFSCLKTGTIEHDYADLKTKTLLFSTYRYVDGMYIVKDYEGQNFQFEVTYDRFTTGKKVIGFDCSYYNGTKPGITDVGLLDVTALYGESYLVTNVNIGFTVEQLEKKFQ